MEDSFKGVLVTLTLILLFITSVCSFLVMFPEDQGVVFTSGADSNTYLVITDEAETSSSEQVSLLDSFENQSTTGFDQWDTTVGFMGSNSIKQSSKGSLSNMLTRTGDSLKTMALEVFGSGSPILYALTTLLGMGGIYLIYVIIKFVRTGL